MIAQVIGWVLIAGAATNASLRQLARWSPLEAVTGTTDISPWWTVALAATGLFVLLLTSRWRQRPVWTRGTTAALGLVLFACGSTAQHALGARLQSDGFFYYAFTRSIWFDHDLNLTNDYALLGIDDAQHQFLLTPTVTGYAHSAWAIGPALAWSPFVAVGHVTAHVLAAGGADVKTDGTSFPYRQAVCLGGLFYGLLGLWFSFQLARLSAPASLAALATIAIGAGTFLLWYVVREPSMSHTVSMAAVAGFVWSWLRWRGHASLTTWALLGLAGGVMVIMRWQNALVLIVPAALLWRRPSSAVAFGAGVVVGTLPQMWTWHALYGEWITQPPVSPRMFWWQAQWVDVLWSSRSGLFAVSPLTYLGALGLLPLWKRHRTLAVMGLLTMVAMTWTNGAVEDWWAGASFGGRRFDSVLPFLTCGLATMLVLLRGYIATHPVRTLAAALATLVVWNLTLAGVARAGTYRIGTIVSFGELASAQARVAHDWIGHPSSMPANLIWAVANRLPPARFDLLRPNRFLGDPTRPYGRIDIGGDDRVYVGQGWHGVERAGDVTFRWSEAVAEVLVPLAEVAPLWLQIQVTPFEAPGLPPQSLTVDINGQALPDRALTSGWHRLEMPTDAIVWHTGINRVRLRFARAVRPADVGGADGRMLAAAVDYVRIQKR